MSFNDMACVRFSVFAPSVQLLSVLFEYIYFPSIYGSLYDVLASFVFCFIPGLFAVVLLIFFWSFLLLMCSPTRYAGSSLT